MEKKGRNKKPRRMTKRYNTNIWNFNSYLFSLNTQEGPPTVGHPSIRIQLLVFHHARSAKKRMLMRKMTKQGEEAARIE